MKSFSLHPSTLHSTFWPGKTVAHLNRFRLTHRPSGVFVEMPFNRWHSGIRSAAADTLAKKVRNL